MAGVTTLGARNRFLAEHWMPFWNECFAVVAVEPVDAGFETEAEASGARLGLRVAVERHLSGKLCFPPWRPQT